MSEINATIQEEIDLIVKAARGERFHFVVVAYDHLSLIDRVKAALIEKYPERKVTTLKVGAEPNTDFIQNILEAPSGLVFIDDFELLLKNEALALGFNQKRDLITKLAIALVCFVPFDRKLLQECPRKIPDMWSVRSLLAELRGYSTSKGLEFITERWDNSYLNSSLEEKEKEIAALQKRIQAIDQGSESAGLLGQLYQSLGALFYSLGHYKEGISANQSALNMYKIVHDALGESEALNNLGTILLEQGDYESALHHLEQSLAIRQQLGDRFGEGTTLNNISQIYRIRGDYDTALRYLEQSLAISQQIGDRSNEGATLNNISQIYRLRGYFDTALHYLEQSLAITQQIGNRSGESTILNNFSLIHRFKGDYGTALRYSEKSLAISQQLGNRSKEGTILNNISQIYLAKGDYDTALRYLEQSLAIQEQLGDHHSLRATLHNIATLYLNQKGDFQKYLEMEMLAYQTAQEAGDVHAIYSIGWYLGSVLCRYGEIEYGLAILQSAYQVGLQAGYSDVEEVADLIKKYSNNTAN